MSCKRTQEFLAHQGIEDGEIQNANREPIRADGALALLDGVRQLLVAKGRRVERFDLAGERPGDLPELLLGRSGKLRAPTMRIGDRLLVGYNREMLESAFGEPA